MEKCLYQLPSERSISQFCRKCAVKFFATGMDERVCVYISYFPRKLIFISQMNPGQIYILYTTFFSVQVYINIYINVILFCIYTNDTYTWNLFSNTLFYTHGTRTRYTHIHCARIYLLLKKSRNVVLLLCTKLENFVTLAFEKAIRFNDFHFVLLYCWIL